jgi:hypothetical protein
LPNQFFFSPFLIFSSFLNVNGTLFFVAMQSVFTWDDFILSNMSLEVGQPVAVAAMTQVKLCPYDEEEAAIWFRLIKA